MTPETVLIWAAVSSRPQDKYSIEDQLKLAREWCQRTGAVIADELVIRGFSRDYWTLADVVAAAASEPDMQAFARLQEHIRRKTFTLFICLDADRFGRTTSLVHEVIGRITRDCGARIYTLFDGMWIDASNATMIGTMKAFKAQSDIDKLREYRHTGAVNRAQHGKVSQGRPPLFQRVVRDQNGNEIDVVINEDLRPLWTDLATVILRGTAWNAVEQVLFEEFGHGARGKPYRVYYMYRLMYHPAFWGHSVLNLRLKNGRSIQRTGAWAWDESVTPPTGVTVYYRRFPAVYAGEWAALGEQVKTELWRRLGLRGKALPQRTHRFSGLVLCDECGFLMHYVMSGKNRYLRCDAAVARTTATRSAHCSQKRYLRYGDVQAWIAAQLQAELDGATSFLFTELNNADAVRRQIEAEQRRADRLRARAESLIVELADAPDSLKAAYRATLNDTAAELDRAAGQVNALRGSLNAMQDASGAQSELLSLLREHGSAWFWQQSDRFIHQQLSAALGTNRLVAREGKLIGVIPMTRKSAWRFS